MASWSEFAAAEPLLAGGVRALVHQYGPGLAYLATVRRDGGPRVHPVSPVITGDGLYCLLMDSPKRRDLERDGRYSLHAYPPEDNDDEAYLSGEATPVSDELRLARVARAVRAAPRTDWRLFELTVEVAMLVHNDRQWAAPDAPREYRIWRDLSAARHTAVDQAAR